MVEESQFLFPCECGCVGEEIEWRGGIQVKEVDFEEVRSVAFGRPGSDNGFLKWKFFLAKRVTEEELLQVEREIVAQVTGEQEEEDDDDDQGDENEVVTREPEEDQEQEEEVVPDDDDAEEEEVKDDEEEEEAEAEEDEGEGGDEEEDQDEEEGDGADDDDEDDEEEREEADRIAEVIAEEFLSTMAEDEPAGKKGKGKDKGTLPQKKSQQKLDSKFVSSCLSSHDRLLSPHFSLI